MKETLEQLYENWCTLANQLEAKARSGVVDLQLEWNVDKAFMRYVKAMQAKGAEVDMEAARRCVGGIE